MSKATEHAVCDELVLVHHVIDQDDGSDGYVISFGGGGWIPGSYDSEQAALLGAKACFVDESAFAAEVQRPINWIDRGNRMITSDDVEQWLAARGAL